jgi:hypothetical protein
MAREGECGGCEWYQSIGLYISADIKKKFKEILQFNNKCYTGF